MTTAAQTYGYNTKPDITSPMSEGINANPSEGLHVKTLGPNNPLFWLLIILLLIAGYIGFAFDFHVKKVGGVKAEGGK